MSEIAEMEISRTSLHITKEHSTGTLELDTNDYRLFGFAVKPFALTASPLVEGHTNERIYHVKAPYHYYGASLRLIVPKRLVKII